MSFGDLQSMPTSADLRESPTPPTTNTTSTSTELQRLLKPLALNNAALKETTRELMSTSATTTINTTTLKRMRALRDQNRHIASAVANLLATSTDESQQVEDEQHVELKRLLQEFQHVLSQSIQVERNIMSRNSSSQNSNPNYEYRQTSFDESDPLLIDNQQDEVQAENYHAVIDMKHVYLNERSSSLSQIQSSVDDVNSIFKELASLVNEQRSQVEYIDMNMDDSKRQIEVARRELEITRRKRNARKSLFFCTLIIISLVIAIFLIIMLT